uniref:Auxin-responsive protein n=1 Tax=Leersia perrieri TaxID=77586 RepID=A0A0D9XAM0_9ORYZ
MISSKKLAQLSKKWQGMGGIGRKRVTTSERKEIIHHSSSSCSSVAVAGKGNCVVYSCDGNRFEIPLSYLGTPVIAELLRMSQEEFGFTTDGRITLPCDTAVMEYVMCLLRREASEEVEKALLSSIVMPCKNHTSRMAINQNFAVCSM